MATIYAGLLLQRHTHSLFHVRPIQKEHCVELNGTELKQFSQKYFKLISTSLKFRHHRQLCFLDLGYLNMVA